MPMSEAEWSERVLGFAQLRHWMCVHYRPAMTGRGWRTAFQGHPGAPDWLFARKGTILLVELKAEKGRYGRGQREWAEQIGDEFYRLWRPSDWPQVMEELR